MKKIFSGLLLMVLGTFLCAGCGLADNPKPPAVPSKSKQVLKAMFVAGANDKAIVDIIRKITEKFNATNRYHVEVQVETYENEQYKTKLSALMASDAAPDIFFTWPGGFLKPFVEEGKVFAIGTLLNQDAAWKGRFNDGVFAPVTFNGRIYAIPHGQAIAVMFYNTRIFQEQGIEVPKTFTEFKEVCRKLREAGIVPIAASAKDAWIAGQFMLQMALGIGGMDLYDQVAAKTKPWNDPQLIEAGDRLAELVNLRAFPKGFLSMTADEGRNLFAQEKAAMYFMGSWDLNALSAASVPVAGNIGVFVVPPVDPAHSNVLIGDVDQCFAISSKCQNAEAAAAYIKMFSDPEIQERYAYDAQYLIATRTKLDTAKVTPLFWEISKLRQNAKQIAPWVDRRLGFGEGVEFNNAAQAIMAGENPAARMTALQQLLKDNAFR
ncbi:Hypothetical protein LUCI_0925 [Lucifera butyrica]|uniref:Bacterial extracellular solute-binding protein n=1 Tax=Lucifera butyrica TaxID=1351585 RepID=A0A498R2M5_9FIRM|nr:extracellular solute-binding protein [Lucifera butyrica]VBB05714.1 Hypothetical protein LUCI_0925 [Lucifera butyrica]